MHPGLEQGLNFNPDPNNRPRDNSVWWVYNDSDDDCPPGGLIEILGTCDESGLDAPGPYFLGDKPSGDSKATVLVAENGILSGRAGQCTIDDRYNGITLALDPAEDAPSNGDTLGSQSDSFYAKKDNVGFVVMAANEDLDVAFCKVCCAVVPEEFGCVECEENCGSVTAMTAVVSGLGGICNGEFGNCNCAEFNGNIPQVQQGNCSGTGWVFQKFTATGFIAFTLACNNDVWELQFQIGCNVTTCNGEFLAEADVLCKNDSISGTVQVAGGGQCGTPTITFASS